MGPTSMTVRTAFLGRLEGCPAPRTNDETVSFDVEKGIVLDKLLDHSRNLCVHRGDSQLYNVVQIIRTSTKSVVVCQSEYKEMS